MVKIFLNSKKEGMKKDQYTQTLSCDERRIMEWKSQEYTAIDFFRNPCAFRSGLRCFGLRVVFRKRSNFTCKSVKLLARLAL